jgi:hypothetical protein
VRVRHLAGLAVVITAAALLSTPAGSAAAARTWYVSASAASGGNGTAARPFRSLAAVEKASRTGDVIRVLPSRRTLNGGIRLKPGQQLIGSGPAVTSLATTASAPRVTNTTGARLAGDAVRLADGATVRNLRIVGAHRGAVYGLETTGVTVQGNDVSQHNASCTPGFLIPEFVAPTNVPGVGVPIVGGLQNGWAGIMIDAQRRAGGTATVSGNKVHDALCGDGIDVRTWGTASYRVRIAGNNVHSLEQGPDFRSILAIGLQARDSSTLLAQVSGNKQANLGSPDDVNLGPEGADSEGVFVNGVGPSTLRADVSHNRYTNADGDGGFSANGLEMVTMGNGSRASVTIRDSHFSGPPGDVIEEGALGTNARLDMSLERVTAERSTGVGNTWVLPFNNGDCLLAGSLGAGNDVRLKVRDSVLRDCSNNGLSIGSNVVNGDGPTKNISLDVDRATITGNRGGNLGIRNYTALTSLSIKVQRTDLSGSTNTGSSIADVAAEDEGSTASSVIDLGGGPLGSLGGNCVDTSGPAASIIRYGVSARRMWWGQPGGPAPLSTLVLGGSLDSAEPLNTPPTYC